MLFRKKIPFPTLLLIVTSIIALIYTALWFKAASVLENTILNWVSQQNREGLQVEHRAIKIHGFPFFLRATIDGPSFANARPITQNGDSTKAHPNRWQWKSEFLDIDILPYDFSKIVFSPRGSQILQLPQAEERLQNWQGSANQIRASLGRDKDREWFFVLDIVAASLSTQDKSINVAFSDLLINVGPNPQNETILHSSLLVNKLNYNEEASLQRNASLDEIQIALSTTHIDQFEGESPVTFWASKGGQLNIDRVLLTKTPSQFAAKGKMSLDRAGFPEGEISMHIAKPSNFIEIIQNSNLLTNDQTQALTGATAIAVLTGGGKIDKQFLFHDGRLMMDGQDLAELPKVFAP